MMKGHSPTIHNACHVDYYWRVRQRRMKRFLSAYFKEPMWHQVGYFCERCYKIEDQLNQYCKNFDENLRQGMPISIEAQFACRQFVVGYLFYELRQHGFEIVIAPNQAKFGVYHSEQTLLDAELLIILDDTDDKYWASVIAHRFDLGRLVGLATNDNEKLVQQLNAGHQWRWQYEHQVFSVLDVERECDHG